MHPELSVVRGITSSSPSRRPTVHGTLQPYFVDVHITIDTQSAAVSLDQRQVVLDRVAAEIGERVRLHLTRDFGSGVRVSVSDGDLLEGPGARIAPAIGRARALTPREQQIAVELSRGASNRDIAERFGLSVHTVRHHTERVLAKLRVRSRAAVGRRLRDLSVDREVPRSARRV